MIRKLKDASRLPQDKGFYYTTHKPLSDYQMIESNDFWLCWAIKRILNCPGCIYMNQGCLCAKGNGETQ